MIWAIFWLWIYGYQDQRTNESTKGKIKIVNEGNREIAKEEKMRIRAGKLVFQMLKCEMSGWNGAGIGRSQKKIFLKKRKCRSLWWYVLLHDTIVHNKTNPTFSIINYWLLIIQESSFIGPHHHEHNISSDLFLRRIGDLRHDASSL